MDLITVPDTVPHTQLVDLGTQQAITEARREAALSARDEIERSCREFIGDCVAALRERANGKALRRDAGHHRRDRLSPSEDPEPARPLHRPIP